MKLIIYLSYIAITTDGAPNTLHLLLSPGLAVQGELCLLINTVSIVNCKMNVVHFLVSVH